MFRDSYKQSLLDCSGDNDSWCHFGLIAKTSGARVTVKVTNDALLSEVTVGSYLVVSTGDYGLLGQIEILETASGSNRANATRAEMRLINSINLTDGETILGVAKAANPGDEVFIAPAEVIKMLLQGDQEIANEKVVFSLATVEGQENTSLAVTPEMMFSRHLAILGATGGGKSYTVAKLIEESCSFNSKMVLFDPTGEFSSLNKGARHIHLGYASDTRPGSVEVALPYFQLRESDLFAIFRPTGESQAPKLRAAIKSLKLSLLQPNLSLDGLIMKANRTKVQYETAYQQYYPIVENHLAEFDITRLARQIINECVHPTRSPTEPFVWGDVSASDQANCVPLINRIQDAIQSKHLACVFNPGDRPSLFEEIDVFMADSEARVLVISLADLSFANHAREIVANATGRHLLEVARRGQFKKQPLVVMVDEAHHFLSEKLLSEDNDYPLNAFALIAKEGRKYGLNICLATQRPRDIPEDVLSQMGTMIVHRLINENDRRVVESACGSIDTGAVAQLPILSPGQAMITGVSFPAPILIRVKAPLARPKSDGPNYQGCWSVEGEEEPRNSFPTEVIEFR
jgi:DNA helicase HerA-like ATPase